MIQFGMQPLWHDARIDRWVKIGIAAAVLFAFALLVWVGGWKFLLAPAIVLVLSFLVSGIGRYAAMPVTVDVGVQPPSPRRPTHRIGGGFALVLMLMAVVYAVIGWSGAGALGVVVVFAVLKRDGIWLNHHRALAFCLSMIFSENRYTLFRIML